MSAWRRFVASGPTSDVAGANAFLAAYLRSGGMASTRDQTPQPRIVEGVQKRLCVVLQDLVQVGWVHRRTTHLMLSCGILVPWLLVMCDQFL